MGIKYVLFLDERISILPARYGLQRQPNWIDRSRTKGRHLHSYSVILYQWRSYC